MPEDGSQNLIREKEKEIYALRERSWREMDGKVICARNRRLFSQPPFLCDPAGGGLGAGACGT